MHDFLEVLVELVLPRLKDWDGFTLPTKTISETESSGSLSFGLPNSAMALFPQVEVQLEQYPTGMRGLGGFSVSCVTNARGVGAQDKARALLSGFRIPFVAKK